MRLTIVFIVQLAINMIILVWCEDIAKNIDKLTDRIETIETVNRIEYL
jgi:hypothetical protein